jgi:ubiquinone/menaquinone biosynthesis C-methylase UbiE
MIEENPDLAYEPFSREPEYIEVNRQFVENINLSPCLRLLDLGCGTGTLTALLVDQIASAAGKSEAGTIAQVCGVDPSLQSLNLAEQYVAGLPVARRAQISWLQGSSENIPLKDKSVDAVTIGNAIQLFENKDQCVREISRVLRLGGILAFNTSFYAGCYPVGSEPIYFRWVQEALAYIKQKDSELRYEGASGIPRKKGSARPAFSNPWLSRKEYEQLLVRNGFRVRDVVERTVQLSRRSLEQIGSYAGLANVLLSGYPPQVACEALAAAAGPALAAYGADHVPRYWIEFVSSKVEPVARAFNSRNA